MPRARSLTSGEETTLPQLGPGRAGDEFSATTSRHGVASTCAPEGDCCVLVMSAGEDFHEAQIPFLRRRTGRRVSPAGGSATRDTRLRRRLSLATWPARGRTNASSSPRSRTAELAPCWMRWRSRAPADRSTRCRFARAGAGAKLGGRPPRFVVRVNRRGSAVLRKGRPLRSRAWNAPSTWCRQALGIFVALRDAAARAVTSHIARASRRAARCRYSWSRARAALDFRTALRPTPGSCSTPSTKRGDRSVRAPCTRADTRRSAVSASRGEKAAAGTVRKQGRRRRIGIAAAAGIVARRARLRCLRVVRTARKRWTPCNADRAPASSATRRLQARI